MRSFEKAVDELLPRRMVLASAYTLTYGTLSSTDLTGSSRKQSRKVSVPMQAVVAGNAASGWRWFRTHIFESEPDSYISYLEKSTTALQACHTWETSFNAGHLDVHFSGALLELLLEANGH